jgi:excisionase family DNA binding protein
MNMEPVLLTTKEAAKMLAFSPRKVQDLMKSGELRSVKAGRHRRIKVEEIHKFIAALEQEQDNVAKRPQST